MTAHAAITERFDNAIIGSHDTADGIETLIVRKESLHDVISVLRDPQGQQCEMLYDLTVIDERTRQNKSFESADFTMVYHLLSFSRNKDIRIKVPLSGEYPSVPSLTPLFENANWYEREAYDMFGVNFSGHPNLSRLLMPKSWQGHPLRKEHPSRATEMGPFELSDEKLDDEQSAMQFKPEEWGMARKSDGHEYMFLNLGPQHPGTHGILRVILQLDGEEIIDSVLDIGFHHRGAEKMGERQNWHSYIPYTDRVDYLGGVMNNLAYLLAVEQLGAIKVPSRAQMIRVMLCELFRISSHLVWYGTFAADIGSISPVFYMFNDRERVLKIVEGITGGRMHPGWFRIGGVAHDLPDGWQEAVMEFVRYFPKRIKEYDDLIMRNAIFKGRTVGVGAYSKKEAIDWGVTGPGLRATGMGFDFRKARPYSGYEQFDFDVPVANNGDCYDRAVVRIEEMRQSLRIIEQCVKNMPSGDYKSDHPLTTPPRKDKTLIDIETLINHFLNTTWGPVLPKGESFFGIEATKGNNGYYLVSDGGVQSYRTRIRTPSFAHLQMLPLLCKGGTISDLMAILGSIDYVLADLDR